MYARTSEFSKDKYQYGDKLTISNLDSNLA